MDHFTQDAQAIITSSQMATATAEALWEQFIVHYRLPEAIVSNEGHNFESGLI